MGNWCCVIGLFSLNMYSLKERWTPKTCDDGIFNGVNHGIGQIRGLRESRNCKSSRSEGKEVSSVVHRCKLQKQILAARIPCAVAGMESRTAVFADSESE